MPNRPASILAEVLEYLAALAGAGLEAGQGSGGRCPLDRAKLSYNPLTHNRLLRKEPP